MRKDGLTDAHHTNLDATGTTTSIGNTGRSHITTTGSHMTSGLTQAQGASGIGSSAAAGAGQGTGFGLTPGGHQMHQGYPTTGMGTAGVATGGTPYDSTGSGYSGGEQRETMGHKIKKALPGKEQEDAPWLTSVTAWCLKQQAACGPASGRLPSNARRQSRTAGPRGGRGGEGREGNGSNILFVTHLCVKICPFLHWSIADHRCLRLHGIQSLSGYRQGGAVVG
jgi:hypothetical protein